MFRGRSNNVKTAKGTKVSTVFAVLEADQVIASHTATGLKILIILKNYNHEIVVENLPKRGCKKLQIP
jgi:hypothetical protein